MIQLGAMALPVALFTASVLRSSWILAILAAGSIFAVVALVPLCRRRESLWVFLITAVATIPLNIWIVHRVMDAGYFSGSFAVTEILWYCLVYFIGFSLEELLFGILARLIWKRQLRNRFSE